MTTTILLLLLLHLLEFSHSAPQPDDTHIHVHLPPEGEKGKIANTKAATGEKGKDYQDDDDPDAKSSEPYVDANKAFDGNSGVTCGTAMTAFNGAAKDEVIGGQQSNPNAFPWMVLIEGGCAGRSCGGALITSKHILTTYHCTMPLGESKPCDHSDGERVAILGQNHRSRGDSAEKTRISIIDVKVPEEGSAGFDMDTADLDDHSFAIYVLKEKAQLVNDIAPICLPPQDADCKDNIDEASMSLKIDDSKEPDSKEPDSKEPDSKEPDSKEPVLDKKKGSTIASSGSSKLNMTKDWTHAITDGGSLSWVKNRNGKQTLQRKRPIGGPMNRVRQPGDYQDDDSCENPYAGQDAVAAGWGMTMTQNDRANFNWTKEQSSLLRQVNLRVSEHKFKHKYMFGTEVGKGNGEIKDVCKGDGGGPLMKPINGKWIIIGTLYGGGYNCETGEYTKFEGQEVGIWNKVSAWTDWILKTVGGEGGASPSPSPSSNTTTATASATVSCPSCTCDICTCENSVCTASCGDGEVTLDCGNQNAVAPKITSCEDGIATFECRSMFPGGDYQTGATGARPLGQTGNLRPADYSLGKDYQSGRSIGINPGGNFGRK